jgi:hypothetical protein
MFRTCLRSAAFAVPTAFLLALLATPSSALQRNVTIYQIQDTTSVGHVAEGSPDTVTASGICTGADTRPTGFGFYIQDPAGGFFSGVQVFTGGANVFADSGYARGDIIQATGRVLEFGGGTELGSPSGSAFGTVVTTKKLGTAALPSPLACTFSNMNELAAYNVAEKFEGVLVQLSGTGRTARSGGAVGLNQYLIVDSSLPPASALDSVRVDGQTVANPSITPPALGVIVSNVKGLAYQSTRGYVIQLRDGADITQPSPPAVLNAWATSNNGMRILFDRALDPTTAQNAGNYTRSTLKAIDSASLVGPANQAVNLVTNIDPQIPGEAEGLTAAGVKSSLGVVMNPMTAAEAFRAGITPITAIQTNFTVNPPFHPAPSDSSQYTFQQVTTRGIVTAVDNQTYYIQNGNTSNPSSGMIIFAPIDNLNQGDDVTVSGVITEFGSLSQATEYSGLDYQLVNATGVALPTPVTVNPGAVGALTGSEPFPGERYEGMLVHFDHVWVAADSLPNGQYLVQFSSNLGDTARVDDNIYHHLYKYGTGLNVTGVVNDAFGQYVVVPRSAADVDSNGTAVGIEPGAGSLAFGLRSISPNPISFARGGNALVRFTLPASGKVSVRVFDLAGRLVAEPAVNVQMAAGPQTLSLDGRSRSGGALGSGIFFVQLNFENRVATGKMVVTE